MCRLGSPNLRVIRFYACSLGQDHQNTANPSPIRGIPSWRAIVDEKCRAGYKGRQRARFGGERSRSAAGHARSGGRCFRRSPSRGYPHPAVSACGRWPGPRHVLCLSGVRSHRPRRRPLRGRPPAVACSGSATSPRSRSPSASAARSCDSGPCPCPRVAAAELIDSHAASYEGLFAAHCRVRPVKQQRTAPTSARSVSWNFGPMECPAGERPRRRPGAVGRVSAIMTG